MKDFGFYRISLAILLAAWLLIPETGYAWLAAGQSAPNFSMEDVNGKIYTLSDMKDRRLAILIFAIWSPNQPRGTQEVKRARKTISRRRHYPVGHHTPSRETVAGFMPSPNRTFRSSLTYRASAISTRPSGCSPWRTWLSPGGKF